jgi:hypothetical protein
MEKSYEMNNFLRAYKIKSVLSVYCAVKFCNYLLLLSKFLFAPVNFFFFFPFFAFFLFFEIFSVKLLTDSKNLSYFLFFRQGAIFFRFHPLDEMIMYVDEI